MSSACSSSSRAASSKAPTPGIINPEIECDRRSFQSEVTETFSSFSKAISAEAFPHPRFTTKIGLTGIEDLWCEASNQVSIVVDFERVSILFEEARVGKPVANASEFRDRYPNSRKN
jgi:hypothetical protein